MWITVPNPETRGWRGVAPWEAKVYDSSDESAIKVSPEGVAMPAYVVLDIDVFDNEKYEVYKQMAPPTILPYEGRYIVRGGKVETMEGDWSPKRVVILEFPSVEKAKAWANSPEYAKAKAMRHESSRSQLIVVEGL